MTIKKIIKIALTAVAVVCGMIGGVVIFGAVGAAECDPEITYSWFLRRVLHGICFFITAIVNLLLEDVLEDEI